MFKRNTRALGGAALCGALLVSGCANQMSQRSEHEERVVEYAELYERALGEYLTRET